MADLLKLTNCVEALIMIIIKEIFNNSNFIHNFITKNKTIISEKQMESIETLLATSTSTSMNHLSIFCFIMNIQDKTSARYNKNKESPYLKPLNKIIYLSKKGGMIP